MMKPSRATLQYNGASVRLELKTLIILDEEVKSLVSAWRLPIINYHFHILLGLYRRSLMRFGHRNPRNRLSDVQILEKERQITN